MQKSQRQVIRTHEAQCRDCYRCLRHCPVKAIRMTGRQASIEPQLCLACGHCVGECPQKAKAYRRDLHTLQEWLQAGNKVAVSLAPSFAASFEHWEQLRVVAALRCLGIGFIAETAVGVELLAQEHARLLELSKETPVITSACAAVVNLIEIYYPHLRRFLAPVLSPMLAHGDYLKKSLGSQWKVVFIGPCIAKKSEVDGPRNKGFVDLALTFEELRDLFTEAHLSLSSCEESPFDDEANSQSSTYPLKGGHLHSLGEESSPASPLHYTASGYGEVYEALESLAQVPRPCHIEAFLCPEGCVGGPIMATEATLFERRVRIARYGMEKRNRSGRTRKRAVIAQDLCTVFNDKAAILAADVNEADILEVLRSTGKLDPKDQLNCGSCGFSSCREKAIAVVKGMAVPEVCLPYMRRLAERRTDRIIETSPNGIVILDQDLKIIGMNPAFQKMFSCGTSTMGRRISAIMDADLFERLLTGERERVEATIHHTRYGIICHEISYALREEGQFIGIFVNLTDSMGSQEKFDALRAKTSIQASELLDSQVRMAQQIARMLGEHTAQAEKIVNELVRIATDKVVASDDWKSAFRLGPPKELK